MMKIIWKNIIAKKRYNNYYSHKDEQYFYKLKCKNYYSFPKTVFKVSFDNFIKKVVKITCFF